MKKSAALAIFVIGAAAAIALSFGGGGFRSLAEALEQDVGMSIEEFQAQAAAGVEANQMLEKVDFEYDDVWIQDAKPHISIGLEDFAKASKLGFEAVVNDPLQIELEAMQDAHPENSYFIDRENSEVRQMEASLTAAAVYTDNLYRGGYGYSVTYSGGGSSRCTLGFAAQTMDSVIKDAIYSAGHCVFTGASLLQTGMIGYSVYGMQKNLWNNSSMPLVASSTNSGYGGKFGNYFDGSLLRGENANGWIAAPELAMYERAQGDVNAETMAIYDSMKPVNELAVCKVGSTSGFSCGIIYAQSYTANVSTAGSSVNRQVAGFNTSLCARSGDSGGAVFAGNYALGVISAASSASLDYCAGAENNTLVFPIDAASGTYDLIHLFPDAQLKISASQLQANFPADGSVVAPSVTSISGHLNAKAGSSVTVTIDALQSNSAVTNANGDFSIAFSPLGNGVHSAVLNSSSAPSYNKLGISLVQSAQISFSVAQNGQQNPDDSGSGPAEAGPYLNSLSLAVSPPNAVVNWDAFKPESVSKIVLHLSNAAGSVQTATVSGLDSPSFTFDNASYGTYSISAYVFDEDGQISGSRSQVVAAMKQAGVAENFDDVKKLSAARQGAIQWLSKYGITAGCGGGGFCPQASINRGALAEMLVKLAGVPIANAGSSPYADVVIGSGSFSVKYDGSAKYVKVEMVSAKRAAAINWLGASGITVGSGAVGGQIAFHPHDAVSRGQMAQFLRRFMWGPPDPGGKNPFKDLGKLTAERRADVLWLYHTGITYGSSASSFSPAADMNRGAFAEFLHRTSLKFKLTGN